MHSARMLVSKAMPAGLRSAIAARIFQERELRSCVSITISLEFLMIVHDSNDFRT